MSERDAAVLFGRAVRKERFELGLSQEELADRASLHRTYISDVELGMRNVSIESIAKLAQALNLSVPRLFARADLNQDPQTSVEILLVEENPRDVELTLRASWKARITNVVKVARDSAEALADLFGENRAKKPNPPGVILLDLNLPKLSGLEVLAEIKRNKGTQRIPVIVHGFESDADIGQCQRLGVIHYVVKPVGFHSFSDLTPSLGFTWKLQKAKASTAA